MPIDEGGLDGWLTGLTPHSLLGKRIRAACKKYQYFKARVGEVRVLLNRKHKTSAFSRGSSLGRDSSTVGEWRPQYSRNEE